MRQRLNNRKMGQKRRRPGRPRGVSTEAAAVVRRALEGGHLLPARDILALARRARPGLGRATLYRALASLWRSGEVAVVKGERGSLFHLCPRPHSHHIICRSCLRAVEIPSDEMHRLEAALGRTGEKTGRALGFRVEGHTLEFTGLCATCEEGSG